MPYRDEVKRTVDWMTGSVEACETHPMNMAVATLICAYCEALGAHLRASQRETGESELNFTAFIRSYMTHFMASGRESTGNAKKKRVRVNREVEPARSGDHKELEYPEILYKKFRCGFAHEFFSKHSTGIIRDTKDHQFPYIIDNEPEYDLVLNLTHLVPDFLNAARRFRADVLADAEVPLIQLSGTTTVRAGHAWDQRGEFLLRK